MYPSKRSMYYIQIGFANEEWLLATEPKPVPHKYWLNQFISLFPHTFLFQALSNF